MAPKESQKSLDSWTKEEWGTKSGNELHSSGKNATGEALFDLRKLVLLCDKEYADLLLRSRACHSYG